jgi:protein-tyrosine phosphatase
MTDGAVVEPVLHSKIGLECYAVDDESAATLAFFALDPEVTFGDVKRQLALELQIPSVELVDINREMDDLIIGNVFTAGQVQRLAFTGSEKTLAATSKPQNTSIKKPGAQRKASSGGNGMTLSHRNALQDSSAIIDGFLFLGGQQAASSLRSLRELGINFVLNMCERIPCKYESKKGMHYKVVSIFDTKSADISKYLEECCQFVDEAFAAHVECQKEGGTGGGCLVHCLVGASRSAAIVLAYLVSRKRMPLADAFALVRGRRKQARPNRAFCAQLMQYEVDVLGCAESSMGLADFGHVR